jgi:hypothetical protein
METDHSHTYKSFRELFHILTIISMMIVFNSEVISVTFDIVGIYTRGNYAKKGVIKLYNY